MVLGFSGRRSGRPIARRRWVALALTLIAATATAGGVVDGPPTETMNVKMEARKADYYPIVSRRIHESGQVVLEYYVDAEGHAMDITVRSAELPRLETAAIFLLQDAKFTVPIEWLKYSGAQTPLRLDVIFELQPDCGQQQPLDKEGWVVRLCARPERVPGVRKTAKPEVPVN